MVGRMGVWGKTKSKIYPELKKKRSILAGNEQKTLKNGPKGRGGGCMLDKMMGGGMGHLE